MIELIVVVLIIAIISAAGFQAIGNSHSNGDLQVGRTTAKNLAEGIDQFQRDHGGRVPSAPGGVDWVGASPVDRSNGGQPYVKPSSIDPITKGQVTLVGATGQATGSSSASIQYAANAKGQYVLSVSSLRNGKMQDQCFVSNAGATSSFARSLGAERPC